MMENYFKEEMHTSNFVDKRKSIFQMDAAAVRDSRGVRLFVFIWSVEVWMQSPLV